MQQQAAQVTSACSHIRQQARYGHLTICQEVREDCTSGVRAAALHDLAAHNGCRPCIQRIIQVNSAILLDHSTEDLKTCDVGSSCWRRVSCQCVTLVCP